MSEGQFIFVLVGACRNHANSVVLAYFPQDGWTDKSWKIWFIFNLSSDNESQDLLFNPLCLQHPQTIDLQKINLTPHVKL